jgi:succinyl-diaminopimelate desuccinylase
MDFENVHNWIQTHQDAMVELQSELTARPALGPENGGVGEWDKARFLEQYLREHGLEEIEHYDCPDDRVPDGSRPNFVLTVHGRFEEPCVWVLTHLDVVPPGEQEPDGAWRGWDSDPYVLRRAGDLIVGRGVVDNQQSLVASVFAVRALLENCSPFVRCWRTARSRRTRSSCCSWPTRRPTVTTGSSTCSVSSATCSRSTTPSSCRTPATRTAR